MKLKTFAATAAAVVLALGLTACGGPTLIGVALPETATAAPGEALSLELLYLPDGDADADALQKAADKLGPVRWESSDDAVVTLTEDGRLLAAAPGEAEVTATAGDFSAVCKVTVETPLTDLVAPETLELHVSDTATLEVTLLPETADAVPTFASSDEAVATVDAAGKVTAVGAGECILTTRADELTRETKVLVAAAQPDPTPTPAPSKKPAAKPTAKPAAKPAPAPEAKPEPPAPAPEVTPAPPAPETPAEPAPAPAATPAPPQPTAAPPAQRPALTPDENGVVHGNDGSVGHIELENGHWGTDTDGGNAVPDDNILDW